MLGYALVALGMLTWTFGFYSIVISKLIMPRTGHALLDWVKDDTYYCCIIPCYFGCMLPFVYLNWLSMKYFRHA